MLNDQASEYLVQLRRATSRGRPMTCVSHPLCRYTPLDGRLAQTPYVVFGDRCAALDWLVLN